jgi:hypothetical protein
MESIVFLVRGSASEPYTVTFGNSNDSNLTATCTCKAGQMRQHCKHRFDILDGKSTAIISSNSEQVKTVLEWLSGSDIELSLNEVKTLENELESLKKQLSAAKKSVARAMND